MGTCWSLGRERSWLRATPDLLKTEPSIWRVHHLCQPCQYSFDPYSLSLPLSVSCRSCVMGAALLGSRSRGRRSGQAACRCSLHLHCSSSPFCFPNLSIGSASCRNFSPSGWQPLQVPAWGGLAALKKAERQKDTGPLSHSPLTVHVDIGSPFTPLSRAKYTGAIIQERTSQLWPTARFFFCCPNYCVASYAEILKSASSAFRA